MTTIHQANIPCGGTLEVDPRVAQIFLSHIEIMTATTDRAGSAAARRRDRMFKQLDAKNQGYVALVASAMLRGCERDAPWLRARAA
jgi:hypothetical protein